MTVVVRVEDVAKKYIIRHQGARRNDSLRDEITGLLNSFRRPLQRSSSEEFWALRDISFDVRRGERLGIVGRNGAGKSTLLKVLSRITSPTHGRVSLRGRVASLLEVGTGFHPELTGRENIYLNGAILGMSRDEIRRKFDEIVAFAEIEKFLDTPVKRYSSGMYVRLAFAVAAHLEPEILIMDEVLAVGDLGFQKKCLDRMAKAGDDGATILFVSHNLAALQNLCDTAILLRGGRLAMHGSMADVIDIYLKDSHALASIDLAERTDRKGNGVIRFTSISINDENGHDVRVFHSGQRARLRFGFAPLGSQVSNVLFAVGIDNERGERVAYFANDMVEGIFDSVPDSVDGFEMEIDKLPLTPGTYRLTIFCSANGEVSDWIQHAGSFSVEPGDFFGTGKLPPTSSQGYCLTEHRFQYYPRSGGMR